MIVTKLEVIKNEKIIPNVYEMHLKFNSNLAIKAGQFINIKLDGFQLRRPISISSLEENFLVIIYKVVGKGTLKLSRIFKNEFLDVILPQGNGFDLNVENKEILLVGGGIGVAPLYELAKKLIQNKNKVYVILGFKKSTDVILKEKFKNLGCIVNVVLDEDCSGTVIDFAKRNQLIDLPVYACGPNPMLKEIQKEFKEGYVSLEAHMACGFGVCNSCICSLKNEKSALICKDGPVFKLSEVEIIC